MTDGNRFPDADRVTISDVAARAGVSKGTVSKYFGKGQYRIADGTRERIARAVEELDFQPNLLARDLKRRRTQTVGVVVASVVNPLYAELVAGVDEVLGVHGYTSIIGSAEGSSAKETEVVRSLRARQVDGVVMASVTMQGNEVNELVESGLEVVLASRSLVDVVADTVMVDNLGGARQAVDHLAGHGHRRVAHIAGPQDVVPFQQRRESYDELVHSGTFGSDPDLCVVVGHSTHEAGVDAMDQLLALPEPPSAVFVASDNLALGALEACSRAGVAVPDDLAMVAFDNIWVSKLTGINLTTVDSRAREIGRLAARRLLDRIEARNTGHPMSRAPRVETLTPSLHRRRTCGCTTT